MHQKHADAPFFLMIMQLVFPTEQYKLWGLHQTQNIDTTEYLQLTFIKSQIQVLSGYTIEISAGEAPWFRIYV